MTAKKTENNDHTEAEQPKEPLVTYTFPELGVAVEARSLKEAEAKAKKEQESDNE